MEKCGLLAKTFKNKKNAVPRTHFTHAQYTTVFFCYMKFFEEEFISFVLFKIVLPHIDLSSGFAFMELIVAKFFGFCK